MSLKLDSTCRLRTSSSSSYVLHWLLCQVSIYNLTITHIQDVLWSAQEDSQLIGRIHRRGQQKRVHIYRLIADNSPDVALNAISFNKEAMHAAFLSAPPALSEYFHHSCLFLSRPLLIAALYRGLTGHARRQCASFPRLGSRGRWFRGQ